MPTTGSRSARKRVSSESPPQPSIAGGSARLLEFAQRNRPRSASKCWACGLPPEAHADLKKILDDTAAYGVSGSEANSAAMTIKGATEYMREVYGYVGKGSALYRHAQECLGRKWGS